MYSKAIMVIIAIAAVSLLFFCQCEHAPDTSPEVEYLNTGKKTGAPFSKAVRVGHMLYLSGELGIDPKTGKLASGGIAAETTQAMKNIKNTLEEFGSSLDRVVKCTVMLADINEWQEMNAVYVTFFPKHLPARSAFGTSGLAMGARLEIECWATVGTF